MDIDLQAIRGGLQVCVANGHRKELRELVLLVIFLP